MKVLSTVVALLLAEVYAAGEPAIVAADGRSLARAIRVAGKVEPVFVEDYYDQLDAWFELRLRGHLQLDHDFVAGHHGNPQLTGFLYAPNSELEIDGGGNPNTDNVRGAIVVERAHASGNGNVAYEPPEGVEFEFDPIDSITFLHITKNEVVVGPQG